jgi:hypothetical protein
LIQDLNAYMKSLDEENKEEEEAPKEEEKEITSYDI